MLTFVVKIFRVGGDKIFHVGLVLFVLPHRLTFLKDIRSFFFVFGNEVRLRIQFWSAVLFVHWKNISQLKVLIL